MFSSHKAVKWTSKNRIVIYCPKNPLVGNGGPDASRANGTGGCERREDPPRHGRPAAGLVQHPPGPPRTVSAVPPPGDEGAGSARSVRGALPEGTHPTRDEPEPVRADPGRGPGSVPASRTTDAPVPREAARGVPQNAGADLLQAGRPLAGRVAQAEHRDGAGVLRPERGRRSPRDGDGGRSVGIRAGPRDELLRPEVEGLHGPRFVRPEAVSEIPDAALRGRGHSEPE